LLCSVLIVWLYVDRRIVSRLKLLSGNMVSIAGGDFDKPIVDPADDEIAQMARALEGFRRTAIEVEEYNLRELSEARIQLTNAIESISEGFCLFDKDDRLLIQNNHYRELFGLDDSHLGSSFQSLLRRAMKSRIISDADQEWYYHDEEDYFQKRLAHHRNPPGPYVQKLHDGTWLRIAERKTDDQSTVAIYSDITEIKQNEQALARVLAERDGTLGDLEVVMNAIDYGILFLDRDLNIGATNRAFYQIWGLSRHQMAQAKSFRDVVNMTNGDSVIGSSREDWPEDVESRIEEVKRGSISRHELTTRNGKTILHQCVAIPGVHACWPISISPRSSRRKQTCVRARSAISSPSAAPTRQSGNGSPDRTMSMSRIVSVNSPISITSRTGLPRSNGFHWCIPKTAKALAKLWCST
jgi:PAS domain-containing protein